MHQHEHQTFLRPTSREAIGQGAHGFGGAPLILSNRPTANGVEVVATAEDTCLRWTGARPRGFASGSPAPQGGRDFQASAPPSDDDDRLGGKTTTVQHPSNTDGGPASRHNPVEEDTEQLAMSTLSFQDYVRGVCCAAAMKP